MNNSEALINVINECTEKAIQRSDIPTKTAATVVYVDDNNKYATVEIGGFDTRFTLLNKTGEILSEGERVFVESVHGNLTNGFISERFGEAEWAGGGGVTPDLSAYLKKTGNGKDVTVTFTEATSRTNINTGETLSRMFGKISKFFSSLKNIAFTGNYSDLSGAPDPNDYYNKTTIDTKLSGKQNKLIAGTNITISDDNVISASGGGTGTSAIVDVEELPTITADNKNQIIRYNNKLYFVETKDELMSWAELDDEVAIQSEEPNKNEKIWINPEVDSEPLSIAVPSSLKRSIITATIRANFTPTKIAEYTILPLVEDVSTGDDFEITSDGGIFIKGDINKVLLNFDVATSTSATYAGGVFHVRLANGKTVSSDTTLLWAQDTLVKSAQLNISMPNVLVNINQGDTIYLYYYTSVAGATILGTTYAPRTHVTIESIHDKQEDFIYEI